MKKSEPKMILNISLNSEEIEEKVKIAMDEYVEKWRMGERSFSI